MSVMTALEAGPSASSSGRGACPYDSEQLRVVIAGSVGRRVIHADGQLSETGCRLLMALTEELVRNHTAQVRLDLSRVAMVDLACLRSLRQFQAILRAMGVVMSFTEPGQRRLNRNQRSPRALTGERGEEVESGSPDALQMIRGDVAYSRPAAIFAKAGAAPLRGVVGDVSTMTISASPLMK
jgi:anti-anti-sigma regulatory factor